MRKWILAASFLATAVVAQPAIAQQTHKEYEPSAEAGAGQKLLAQFAGDWDMVKTFYPPRASQPSPRVPSSST